MTKATRAKTKAKKTCNFHKGNKAGAPKGNRNALRHGMRSGELPKDCKDIEINVNKLRRNIEDAVLKSKGQISVTDAGLINTAIKWERHSALAHRWLTRQYKKLKPSEQLHFSKEVATASDKRDAALEALGLGVDGTSSMPWLTPEPQIVAGE